MLGRRAVGTYELTFNDVRVPAEHLIGGENKGWECVLAGLQVERVFAAAAIVAARAASSKSRYSTRGNASSSAVRSDVPGDRAHAGRHADRDRSGVVADVARRRKWFARARMRCARSRWRSCSLRRAYVKAANIGMQIFGGFGYNMEFDMQRHYRDARAATIAAGTSQIQRNLLAGLMGLKVT